MQWIENMRKANPAHPQKDLQYTHTHTLIRFNPGPHMERFLLLIWYGTSLNLLEQCNVRATGGYKISVPLRHSATHFTHKLKN